MECRLWPGRAVGLILDLSLRHGPDGRRLIDTVKRRFAKAIIEALEDDQDVFYLYHPEVVEVQRRWGEWCAALGNHNADGWHFDLSGAFRQTLYVLACTDPDSPKSVVLVTDRLTDLSPLEKGVWISYKEHLDCQFPIIGLGAQYNRSGLQSWAVEHQAPFIHLDDPARIDGDLLRSFWHSREVFDGRDELFVRPEGLPAPADE